MRTRNKVAVGIVAASVAVIGLVLLAAAQGGAGMMGRNAGRMMGGVAAGSTGTCPMDKAQCSTAGGSVASCPMLSAGAAGSAAATCPAAKTGGTCKMGAGSGPTTCPMNQGRSGA